MDNKKIHAVLLGIANKLNFKYKWRIMPDYEIELKSNKITLLARFIKSEVVGGAIDVDVSLHLTPDDANGFFPNVIFMQILRWKGQRLMMFLNL